MLEYTFTLQTYEIICGQVKLFVNKFMNVSPIQLDTPYEMKIVFNKLLNHIGPFLHDARGALSWEILAWCRDLKSAKCLNVIYQKMVQKITCCFSRSPTSTRLLRVRCTQ